MGRSDFVVAIGTDQHEVLQTWPQQILQQIKRLRVEPLQVVEEERQWMVRSGKCANEAPTYELKTALCLLWRQLRNRRLVSDDQLEFGNEVDHEPPVRSQRLQKRVAPARQLGVALAEERPDEALKSLHQCRVRDIALVLVELARCEQPARLHQYLVQFIDD